MPSYRVQRTNEDILRELSAILREMKDPRIADALLSVVKVDVSRDLSSCRVYVSSMSGIEAAQKAVETLKSASGFIRRELGGRLEMRHIPELRFVADGSIEHSASIFRLLHQLEDTAHED
jgi:ribosome-binding factor A